MTSHLCSTGTATCPCRNHARAPRQEKEAGGGRMDGRRGLGLRRRRKSGWKEGFGVEEEKEEWMKGGV